MKRIILGVAAVLMLGAGSAAADGLPDNGRIADVDPVFNWTGFYVGIGVGAGAVVHDLSVAKCAYDHCSREYGEPVEVLSFDGIGGEGIFGTVTIGYDRLLRPGWVGGVFADYDFGSNISTDVSFFGISGSIDHNYSWSVGARLGVLTNPGTLLYGTAGYTQAEFDLFGVSSPTFDGYFVGAGVETFLREDWTLKLEYRYTQFDSENIVDHCPILVDFEPSMHTARLVLSYKFGHHD